MKKFHSTGVKAIWITVVHLSTSVAVSTSLPLFLLLFLLTVSQRRAHCGEHPLYVYHKAGPVRLTCVPSLLLTQTSLTQVIVFAEISRVRTCCLVFDCEMWGFSSSSCDIIPISLPLHGSIYTNNLWFILPTSKPPGATLIYSSCKQQRRQGRAKTRRDLLHESLIF